MAVATKRDFVINYGLQTDNTGTSTGNTLFVDQVNDNVGIGISPAYKLDVDGDINFTGTLYKDGAEYVASRWTLTGSDIYRESKVGINESNPQSQLAVKGYITESTDDGTTYWNVVTQQDIGSDPNQVPLNQYLGKLAFLDDFSPNGLRREGGSSDDVSVNSTGDVVVHRQLHGPSNFIIDPSTVGDDTGTVEIKGNLIVQGTTTTINSTTVDLDHLSLGDNEVANFGDSNDLQIYHDGGSNRTIIDDSSGGLKIQSDGNISFTKGVSENLAVFTVDGAVSLYYDNVQKFQTTSDGVRIGSSTAPIDINAYETLNNGTLSFEGSAGQLFSITNNLTSGSIFAVNDVSGIPSIDVDANGTITLAEFGGNVGIGTSNPGFKLEVNGSFAATTKSFVIDHPTKEGKNLRYGSLEGPENGVYVRGKSSEFVIELPDYWTGLVDEDTITVNLTPFGKTQTLWVKEIKDNKVFVGSKCTTVEYFYTVFGERKDVEKLEVEF